jgi:hypothetical protein
MPNSTHTMTVHGGDYKRLLFVTVNTKGPHGRFAKPFMRSATKWTDQISFERARGKDNYKRMQ